MFERGAKIIASPGGASEYGFAYDHSSQRYSPVEKGEGSTTNLLFRKYANDKYEVLAQGHVVGASTWNDSAGNTVVNSNSDFWLANDMKTKSGWNGYFISFRVDGKGYPTDMSIINASKLGNNVPDFYKEQYDWDNWYNGLEPKPSTYIKLR